MAILAGPRQTSKSDHALSVTVARVVHLTVNNLKEKVKNIRYALPKLLLPIAATLMLHVNTVSATPVDSVNRLRLAENADLVVVG